MSGPDTAATYTDFATGTEQPELTLAEAQRLLTGRGTLDAGDRAWLRRNYKPATEKQVAYIHSLGGTVPVCGLTRKQATRLIGALKRERDLK